MIPSYSNFHSHSTSTRIPISIPLSSSPFPHPYRSIFPSSFSFPSFSSSIPLSILRFYPSPSLSGLHSTHISIFIFIFSFIHLYHQLLLLPRFVPIPFQYSSLVNLNLHCYLHPISNTPHPYSYIFPFHPHFIQGEN